MALTFSPNSWLPEPGTLPENAETEDLEDVLSTVCGRNSCNNCPLKDIKKELTGYYECFSISDASYDELVKYCDILGVIAHIHEPIGDLSEEVFESLF